MSITAPAIITDDAKIERIFAKALKVAEETRPEPVITTTTADNVTHVYENSVCIGYAVQTKHDFLLCGMGNDSCYRPVGKCALTSVDEAIERIVARHRA